MASSKTIRIFFRTRELAEDFKQRCQKYGGQVILIGEFPYEIPSKKYYVDYVIKKS